MKRAFTLVELLVVVGMIAILMGAVGSGVGQARKRAMVARAMQEAKEMTNAILAYENYVDNAIFKGKVSALNDTPAGRSSLGFIIGEEKGTAKGGGDVPVLYNAHVRSSDGAIADPWGMPYRVTVKAAVIKSKSEDGFITAPSFPNFYRLSDEERQ